MLNFKCLIKKQVQNLFNHETHQIHESVFSEHHVSFLCGLCICGDMVLLTPNT